MARVLTQAQRDAKNKAERDRRAKKKTTSLCKRSVQSHADFNKACWAVRKQAKAAGFVVPAESPWKALRAWAEKNGVAWPTAKA